MSYIKDTMAENEVIEKIFSLNWVVYIKGIFYTISAVPAIITAFYFMKKDFLSIEFFGLLFAAILLVVPFFVSLRSIEQGVTNRKLVYKSGVIARETNEIMLDAIQTVEMSQSFFGRIFNYGDIKVIGRGTGELNFKNISDPIGAKKMIENMIEKYN